MKIAVIGLGYVGLPLSFQFARCGVTVLGLDIDTNKVDALNQGRSYIKHIPAEAVASCNRRERSPRGYLFPFAQLNRSAVSPLVTRPRASAARHPASTAPPSGQSNIPSSVAASSTVDVSY